MHTFRLRLVLQLTKAYYNDKLNLPYRKKTGGSAGMIDQNRLRRFSITLFILRACAYIIHTLCLPESAIAALSSVNVLTLVMLVIHMESLIR